MALEPIRPKDLPPSVTVYATDRIPSDDGVNVGGALPVQIVDAGAPVPSEATAIAGIDNVSRMTPFLTRAVLNDETAPSVLLAQAWAESPSPPIPGSKSSKTWAGESAASAIEAALYDGPWLDTVSALIADTSLTYAPALPGTVVAGDYVQTRKEGFAYQVAASGASDHHVTTAGGVKLYVQPGGFGYNLRAFGADNTGVTDAFAAVQAAVIASGSAIVGDGTFKLSSTVVLSQPGTFKGNGQNSGFVAQVGFAGPIFSVAPAVGTNPKGWFISDFFVTNSGSASNVFDLDIAGAGEYISKLELCGVISNTAVSGYFVNLLNTIPNIDGLFTSVFADNWSYGGYYLNNAGDSLVLERNTTTGAGVGYYVNQLGTAANIAIRDGNCTSAGGAIQAVSAYNLIIEGMQIECPFAFTGADNAAISLNHAVGNAIYNTKITNNNINTQGNPLYCIYLQRAFGTVIEGNQLYCDIATGSHIYIDSGSQDTIIGKNRYYNRATGAEVAARITDNGIGTVGIWKDATITLAGWAKLGATENNLGFFKDRDGTVHFRGRVGGGAGAAAVLFTLPVGFRPIGNDYQISVPGAVSFVRGEVLILVATSGAVTILTANATTVEFNAISFGGGYL